MQHPQSEKKSVNFLIRFAISLAFTLSIFVPLGALDALTTLVHSRYLFSELGDRLMVLGFTLIIYIIVAIVVTIISSLFQSVVLRKASDSRSKCAALNFAMIIGLITFLSTAWIYNLVLSEKRWTHPLSVVITLILFIGSFLSAFLVYRSARNRPWRRMIALSNPLWKLGIIGVCIALFAVGQINFVRLFRLPNNLSDDSQKPNIILISIDTLGAKHLGCYGYHRDTSPELDRIANEGVLFKNAFAQAHWTLPSHMTMFTGLHPWVHGMTLIGSTLDDSFITLSEVLQMRGYRTGAFVDSDHDFVVGADYGYAQGFDFYDHTRENLSLFERLQIGKQFRRLITPVGGLLYKLHSKETTDDILGAALHWLARYNQKKPFFLFIHLYDVHSTWSIEIPYLSPEPYQNMYYPDYQGSFNGCDPERKWCGTLFLRRISFQLRKGIKTEGYPTEDDMNYMVATYDGGITYVDHWMGRFFNGLEELELDEKTMVVITSDHGEEFLEHHQIGHRQFYDENIHIPLIVWQKGVIKGGKVVEDLAMSVDLMPTILDAAGVEIQSPSQGVSLMPLIKQEVEHLPRTRIFAGDDVPPEGGVVRTLKDKFIINTEKRASWAFINSTYEYYDLEADPEEKKNLCKKNIKCPDELKEAVNLWRAECDSLNEILTIGLTQEKTKLSKSALRKLRALGYVD